MTTFTTRLLPILRDGRVVLIGIGLMTTLMIHSVYRTLKTIRDDKVIRPASPQTQYITQETEDSLPLETVDKLLQHPNYSIRDSATKILCDRAVNNDSAMAILLHGITVRDYEHRTKSLRALQFLLQQHPDTLIRLHQPDAYAALVHSLEFARHDRPIPILDNDHWDEFPLRDPSERIPLLLVASLVNKLGVDRLIDSMFVQKYLRWQPWGTEPRERQRNFRFYVNFKRNPIAEIVGRIRESTRGYNALQLADLMPRYSAGLGQRNDGEVNAPAQDGKLSGEPSADNTAGTANANEVENVVPRTREHSDEEQRLRRQHREAMVLNDGTRPLRRADIIERDHGHEP